MSHKEFDHVLSTINAFSPDQLRRLHHELVSRLAVQSNATGADGDGSDVTAFDVASRAGLIGCIKGTPRSPTDLSTDPKHMKGFGRG